LKVLFPLIFDAPIMPLELLWQLFDHNFSAGSQKFTGNSPDVDPGAGN
jgi:hypothetical protein